MKKYLFFVSILSLFLAGSCKSSFEKIRTSGDLRIIQKKAMEFYEQGNYSNAQTLFELIMPSLKGQPALEEIAYKYAYTHYYLRSYTSATFYFKNFANTYGSSPLREEAEFMAAYAQYKQSPIYKLDQESTVKAIDGFQSFANSFPESQRVKECNKLIDELRKKLEKKTFEEGQLYYDITQYQASIQVFENMLKDFPETSDAELVRFMILKAQYKLAENSIYEKQSERFKLVLDKQKDLTDKFPKTRFRRETEQYTKIAKLKIASLENVRH